MTSNIEYSDIENESPSSEFRLRSAFERDLRARICVRSPYFQLTDLEPFGEDGVQAFVLFESTPGIEADALASAEVGRHLAILGSCALARNNPRNGRYYYLATDAVLVRQPTPGLDRAEPMRVRARPDGDEWAEITLMTCQGELNSTLRCKYQVLSEPVFQRLFKSHRVPVASRGSAVVSPYRTPITTRWLHAEATTAAALLEEVSPAMCVGHFDEFPAMPVAILMDGMHRLACRHAALEMRSQLRLESARVRAERLAFAGESVEFSVELLEVSGRFVRYEGRATRHGDRGTVFGTAEMLCELQTKSAAQNVARGAALASVRRRSNPPSGV